jgi:hypothetical protein
MNAYISKPLFVSELGNVAVTFDTGGKWLFSPDPES